MTINDSNNIGEENVENQQNNNSSDLSYLKELSKKFARNKLTGANDGKEVKDVKFYNDFLGNKYEKKHYYDELKAHLSGKDLELLIKNSSDSDKNALFESFKSEVNRLSFTHENRIKDLDSLVNERFILDGNARNSVKNAIKNLSSEDISKFFDNPSELYNFVNNNTTSKIKRRDSYKETVKLFENFTFGSSEELREIVKRKIEENPDLLDENNVYTSLNKVLNKIKSGKDLTTIDISSLMEIGIFSEEQKKSFIKIYLPNISLEELVNLNVIDNSLAENKKKEELKKFLAEKKGISSSEISDDDTDFIGLSDSILLSDIYVSSREFLEGNVDNLSKSQNLEKRVSNSFNNFKEGIKDDLLKKILNLEAFKEKVKSDSNTLLKINGGEKSLEKLKDGVVFKIRYKKNNYETEVFYEIDKFLDNGHFVYKDRSLNGKYNVSSDVSNKETDYISFYKALKNKDFTDIEILEKQDLEKKVKSGEIKESSDKIGEATKSDLEGYKSYIEDEMSKISSGKDPEKLEKDEEYQKLREIRDALEKDNAIEDDLVKDKINVYLLKLKIDEKDPNGASFGIKPGTSLKIDYPEAKKDENPYDIITIGHIDSGARTMLIYDHLGASMEVSFDKFYDFLKENNFSRFSSNTSFEGIYDNLSKDNDLGKSWSGFEVKQGQIKSKAEGNTANYEYLVSDKNKKGKNDKVIKIGKVHSGGGSDMVDIQIGKISQKFSKDGKKLEEETYLLGDKLTVSSAFLENYIMSNNLVPETLEKNKEGKEVSDRTKGKWSFSNWLFSNKSIGEMVQGVKMGFDQFTEHLKAGNEEHAASFALATWGKVLPMEVKIQLQSRVEEVQAKSMEAAVSRLKGVDSPQAITLVYKWITHRNTEEYKKEAAMVFMFEKYGTLYNKNYDEAPLNSLKGEFIWFKALTGQRSNIETNPLYQEVKADCEVPDKYGNTKNFTEEELIWKLMKKQCGNERKKYGKVKRRSRLHKEIEKKKKQGIKEEIEDGVKKSSDTRNPVEIMNKGLAEIPGSPGNAVGFLKGHIDRGDSMENMNTIPFILLFSGVALNVPDDLSNGIKTVFTEGRCIPLIRFMSYPKDMHLAINAIRILAEKIQERSKNYPDIGIDANDLYEDFVTGRLSERDRVKKCKDFYNKKGKNGKTYGDILTKVMYMSADGKYDEDSHLSSLLIMEKDKPGEGGSILNNFYNNIQAYMGELNFKDEYFSDSFKQAGTSSLSYSVAYNILQPNPSGSFGMKNSGPDMVKEIKNEIEAIKERTYSSEEERRKWLKYYLRNIFGGLAEAGQTKSSYINDLFKGVGSLKFFDEKRKINFKKIEDLGLDREEIVNGSEKSDTLFNGFVDSILESSGGNSSLDVNDDVFEILGKSGEADDYNYAKAA